MSSFYDVLVWLFFTLMVAGFGGAVLASVYLQWTKGSDSGAPFIIFAGLQMLSFLSEYPLIPVLGALGIIGALGVKMVAPYSSYAAKEK